METFNISNQHGTLDVSKLIFGTSNLGNMDTTQSNMQMNYYVENGGSCIDTARVYSNFGPNNKRSSEEAIGNWMKENGLRKNLIISTKGGHPIYGHMDTPRLTKADLQDDLSQSLEALNTDYVDIYWLHRDDINRPVGDIMETLNLFIKAGTVRFVGASNWSMQRILEANDYAFKNGITPFSATQIQWSYAVATPNNMGDNSLICMNNEIYSDCKKHNLPVFAYESQAKGFFSKMLALSEDELPIKIKERFLNDKNREKAERVNVLCLKYDVTPAVISLAYITSNPLSSGAIFSCSKLSQLVENIQAKDFILSREDIEYLDELV